MPNFGEVDVVPLLGAIAGCNCREGARRKGNDQLWGSGCGAIARCHCRILKRRATVNFVGVDVTAIVGCSVLWLGIFFLYINNIKVSFCYLGLYWYNFLAIWVLFSIGGEAINHFSRLDVAPRVPLLGAMVRFHCWVP